MPIAAETSDLFDETTGKWVGVLDRNGKAQIIDPTGTSLAALVSRAGITADDTGTAWLGAPSLLSFSAVLASGSATTVLLESRDSVGTVSTVATITADTVSQVMRQAVLMRQQSDYRFRRSSGTGSVTITV